MPVRMCASSTCTWALRSATSTAAAARLRAARAGMRREKRARSWCSSSRAAPARIAPLRFTRPLLELEQVRHRIRDIVRGDASRTPRASTSAPWSRARHEARVVARVEAVGDFVEQQQVRPARQRARDEHQPPLAIRKREEAALGERADAEPLEQRRDALLFGGAQRPHRDVGAMHSRADHFARAEVPLVVFVAVLAFGADVRDLFARRPPAGRRFHR